MHSNSTLMHWGHSSVVHHLPGMHKALDLIPSTGWGGTGKEKAFCFFSENYIQDLSLTLHIKWIYTSKASRQAGNLCAFVLYIRRQEFIS
jgi:hypothetical protein